VWEVTESVVVARMGRAEGGFQNGWGGLALAIERTGCAIVRNVRWGTA